jgi:protein phosphatase
MFDLVGDVHGCDDELVALLEALGHPPDPGLPAPAGRRLVFVGDLVDRGPATPAVLRRVMALVAAGRALAVAGNHDVRLAEALRGRPVEPGHGLEESLAQLAGETEAFRAGVIAFLESLPARLVLDDGRLVVAHAGLPEAFHTGDDPATRDLAIHGAYTGDFDERAMPVRDDWAARYGGAAAVVQGHTPVAEAEWFRGTICLDTGCVCGGRLTALRWPERELVAVPARRAWSGSARGVLPPRAVAPRPVWSPAPPLPAPEETVARLRARAATLADGAAGGDRAEREPRAWGPYVVHLPPTMSSCDPGHAGRPLEHPLDAMAHYARQGLRALVCEEKHTGVRVVAVVCRDAAAARRRFGAVDGSAGAIHSRVGRAVLSPQAEAAVVAAIRSGADRAGVWDTLAADWLCLDGELVGAAGAGRADGSGAAPEAIVLFHLLASGGRTHFAREHAWQLGILDRFAAADGGATVRVARHRAVDLEKPVDVAAAIAWWAGLSAAGGEGIVVKPAVAAAAGSAGPVQPALKVRSAAWLERVYGGAVGAAEGLAGLRARSLQTKRARALDQFALGVEALERFVAGEPRPRVASCLDALLDWTPGR